MSKRLKANFYTDYKVLELNHYYKVTLSHVNPFTSLTETKRYKFKYIGFRILATTFLLEFVNFYGTRFEIRYSSLSPYNITEITKEDFKSGKLYEDVKTPFI